MSDKWYRRAKVGPNLTLSIGSKMGPTFSSTMGNKQNRITVVNRPKFTTFRLVNKTGPYSNRTMVRQENKMQSFKEFIVESFNVADPSKPWDKSNPKVVHLKNASDPQRPEHYTGIDDKHSNMLTALHGQSLITKGQAQASAHSHANQGYKLHFQD